MQVTPIDSSRETMVINEVQKYVALSDTLFQAYLDPVKVSFDLTGTTAGMFRVKAGQAEIRFNPQAFSLEFDQHLMETVPHEVSHYVVYRLFGHRNIKPHGKEWQNVMIALGKTPRVSGGYSVDGLSTRKFVTHPYRCACQSHQLTSIRHNRVLKGKYYLCRKCRHPLRPENP